MVIWTDLSEVLIGGAYGLQKFVERSYGHEVAQSFCKRSREMNNAFCDLMRGRMAEEDYWRTFLQGDWPFGIDEAKVFFSQNMACNVENTIDVYRNIIYYPDYLKPWYSGDVSIQSFSHGRPTIWLVSDHIKERIPELEHLHPEIFELTSRQFWSFEVGKLKNERGRFRMLLEENHLNADEVIFVDDSKKNTAAAAKLGIATITFKNAKQLQQDLQSFGFRFAD